MNSKEHVATGQRCLLNGEAVDKTVEDELDTELEHGSGVPIVVLAVGSIFSGIICSKSGIWLTSSEALCAMSDTVEGWSVAFLEEERGPWSSALLTAASSDSKQGSV
ncbi:hypothetical protein DPMN_023772 [Dreissena polymorpha]|uniref:Uncharacterized protein n=1 Tax=Dreissena polymorpha TaxID=45954 RepID=A0A9D4RA78_DREPO|nr:hypothetical protein DPMN_023772 [Dreissena polymorpha]